MSTRNKLIIWASIFIVALIAGLYLSGLFFSIMRDTGGPSSFLSYFYLMENYGHERNYKLAGVAGFGLSLCSWLTLGFVLFLKDGIAGKSKNLYGDAKFASQRDLEKAGFYETKTTSILVGKKGKNYLMFSGQQFPILAAPTRSGKGVGIVIPNLLAYQDSVVVLDIKQENYELTSGFREKHGQEVFVFNPFAENEKSHRWNPLSYVSEAASQRVSDLMSIAAMLYPAGDDPKNAFWLNQAQGMFIAFALFLFDRNKDLEVKNMPTSPPTIGKLFKLSSGDGTEFADYLKMLSEKPFLSPQAIQAFSGLRSQSKDTFSNILATFKAPLTPWLNPVTDAATSDNDFLLTDVRKKRMTIYVAIAPNKLGEAQLILNLFFSQLINLNTKELPQNNPELKYQCLLLMDEFTSMGKVDVIAKSVSYIAGYNIRLFPIIQSLAQLDSVYGKDVSRTLVTNHALQILYTPREQQDANDYSEMLGYTSVKKTSHSKAKGGGSESESEERRALMLPQELKAMSNDKEIFLFEGIERPVMCDKIKYYQDPVFKERLIAKTEVPVLDLTGFI